MARKQLLVIAATVTVCGNWNQARPLYPYKYQAGTGGADGSETIVTSTATVTVTGTGTAADPYLLESTGGADGSETVIVEQCHGYSIGYGNCRGPLCADKHRWHRGGRRVGDHYKLATVTVTVSGTGTTADPYVLERYRGSRRV